MAETKRIQLDAPKSLQREKKSKEVPPTYRFELNLTEDANNGCAEFSYAELVKNERVSERDHGNTGSDDPFSLDDDNDKLQDIARRLEEKYNPKVGRKKKKKQSVSEDFIDRGMGYDETDPFIDNEEAYDELVPSTITTEFGGFYINKGDLEFRDVSESGSVDSKLRKKRRRPLAEKDGRKKRRLGNEENQKRRGRKPLSETVSALPKQKKRTQPTVADMLEQIKAQQQIQQQESVQQMQLNPLTVKMEVESDNEEIMQSVPPVASISDAIESVVKASGEDVTSNGSAGPITGSSDGEDVKPIIENIEAPKLPDNLPPDLDDVLVKLKEAAHKSEEGKCKFFSDEVNRMLLSVELKAQELTSAQRSTIYSHLASHLPCTKETLQKRAKKLRLDQEDGKLREPMQRLKDGIAVVMPTLMEKYAVLVQACDARDEKKNDNLPSTASDGDDSQEEGEKKASRLPKKHFEWNDTIRKCLCDVVQIKLKCYEVSKTRIQSAEEYLKHFLEAEVKNLWPQGWMQSRVLFRESRAAHSYITSRPKKQILIPKKFVNPLSSVMLTMKPAVSLLNTGALSQESEFEPSFQAEKSVPCSTALQSVESLTKKEHDDLFMSANAVDERAAEFAKLFTLPIKNNLSDEYASSKTRDGLISQAITSKLNAETSPKTSPPLLNPVSDAQVVPCKVISPPRVRTLFQSKPTYVSKVPDFNTFTEGSLASDMLSRIICASLAEFPHAGLQTADTSTSKATSVISPNPSSTKESRAMNSKFPTDILASPKKHDSAKLLSTDLRKSSQDTGLHSFSASNIESILNAHRQVELANALAKKQHLPAEATMSGMNLKFKDAAIPHSRQFAEAFERTADTPPVNKKQNMKGQNFNLQGVPGQRTQLLFSRDPISTSPRSNIESSQKMAFEFASKYSTASTVTQGPSTAPYKKRTKYAQGSKSITEQWSQYLDAGLNTSLLEGMKGFPFPVGTLPTPPPAHSSSPIRTMSLTSRSPSHVTSGHRNLPDKKAEQLNQLHPHIPVTESPRRQSLIQGPWKTSPTSQASSTALAHFMTTSPTISNPTKTTSPNHTSNSHLSLSPAPAHSMPHIEKVSAAYNRSHSPLPHRASPSHPPTLGLAMKTSPSTVYTLGQATYTTQQSSHTVSTIHHQANARNNNAFESATTTTSNAAAGTFAANQELKTSQPRSN